MSTRTYKDFKFTVHQVHLMRQLYDSGMTVDEVLAGFKQIRDVEGKSVPAASPPGSTNESSQNVFGYSQGNSHSQNSNHSDQSGFLPPNAQQDFSYQTSNPASVNTSSTPLIILGPPQRGNPQRRAKSSKSRRKKLGELFVMKDE